MPSCTDCKAYGLAFQRDYSPHEFIEGNKQARVWIIGLNPAQDPDWRDGRSSDELLEYFDNEAEIHPYFKQFKAVSPRLFAMLGKVGGAAHTDLVKCSSFTWPPEGVTSSGRSSIIANCSRHLKHQLAAHTPEVINCNGSEVSSEIRRLLPAPEGTPADATQYVHKSERGAVTVVLSGFIGRIDNYSKRRLGRDIEAVLSVDGETSQETLPPEGLAQPRAEGQSHGHAARSL